MHNKNYTKKRLIISGMIFTIFLIVVTVSASMLNGNKKNESVENNINSSVDTKNEFSNNSNPEIISYDPTVGQKIDDTNNTPILSNFEWLEVNANFTNSDVVLIKSKLSAYVLIKNQNLDKNRQISWLLFDYNNVSQNSGKTTFLVDYYIDDELSGNYEMVFAESVLTLDGVEI